MTASNRSSTAPCRSCCSTALRFSSIPCHEPLDGPRRENHRSRRPFHTGGGYWAEPRSIDASNEGAPNRQGRVRGVPLGWFLEAAVGRAALHFGVEPGQGNVVAHVLAQPADVFDRDEDAVALRILELQELGGGPVRAFHLTGPGIPAQSVGGME